MGEASVDPLDISKDSELIKEAQKDLSKIDILVCGGCNEVYHFVEEFTKHKAGQCTGTVVVKYENDEKSQIWGFTLWKTKLARTQRSKGESIPSSWEIYQQWTKLTQLEKDLWITAGGTLQFCNKISSARVKEVKEEKKLDKDPLALDDTFTDLENEISTNEISKTGVVKTGKGGKKALRTNKDNDKEEYIVEKIVGKRFNIRKRIWEYEVKWENYTEETWEPVSHLENCKVLVQEYEEKAKAEKEKAKPPVTPRSRGRPKASPTPGPVKIVQNKPATPSAIFVTSPGGRPQRSSKQKALNQVKAWCGNISDGEETGGVKRPFDDGDASDDSFEKKIKLEGEDEDTDEEVMRKTPIKKTTPKVVHTYVNGSGKKLPDNVLIPDAKGVVRISQKQLPSLSSGVYIMSKSSGIIKLDPTASKIATSGGQAIVKVSPKIGQTQIRIIKKDDGSKKVVQVRQPETPKLTPIAPVVKVSPSTPAAPKIVQVKKTPVQKKEQNQKKGVERVKKVETVPKLATPKPVVKEVKLPPQVFDDSDDGIEEMEFPTDLPLPEPESPPGDFVLDPFTGKVIGQEYPDPEPEPVINEPEPVVTNDSAKETESIDNIVKLAAADITEDDLKSEESPMETTARSTTATTKQPSPATTTSTTTTSIITTTSSKSPNKETLYAVVTDSKTGQSILSTAIANSNILQKTLQSPLATKKAAAPPKTQPRIINQSVAKPRTPIGPPARTNTTPKRAVVRPKPPVLPTPKFNIAPMNPSAVKNVYSKTNNVARRIGNTTVYKTTATKTPSPVKKPVMKPSVAPKPKPMAPKPIISMPSLDEEPAPAPVVVTPKVTQVVNDTPPATVEADLSTFSLASDDRPMFITGDDGTVYQVAGQNEEGQTILITQDSDGQQQCLLVTNEAIQEEAEPEEASAEVLMELQEPVEVMEEQPLVAQFIRTEPPSPGGTHKVVVMLPDGDVMVTQVTPEEYASLELEK